MVSQLLFGETYKILKARDRYWSLIECEYDGYQGWISNNQITEITQEQYVGVSEHNAVAAELYCPVMSDGESKYIPFGASMANFDEMTFKLLGRSYSYGGQVIFPERLNNKLEYIEKLARKFLHTPYLWGGRSSFGLDCSGFVQIIYKAFGIRLPRDASQQVHEGELIDFVSQAEIGDLAFFRAHYKNTVSHVGIVLPGRRIIHASGKVRIDKFDHYGIFNSEVNSYTHLMVVIKRVFKKSDIDLQNDHS
jgi:cell wall-associated NlpC family hydrolase